MEESKKIYSQRAISISTYIGGPLAAGVLIKENYKSLGKPKQGGYAFWLGVVSTIILFCGIFSVPENIMAKIPNMLIPLVYMAIIYLIVAKIQGKELTSHKESNGEFHTGWKAAGVGAICLLIIFASVAIVAFISGDLSNLNSKFDAVSYDKGITKFTENETASLKVLTSTEPLDSAFVIGELKKGIVCWNQNKQIITSLSRLENLPEEFVAQNEKLSRYCDLRIEQFELLLKAQVEMTDRYTAQIDNIGMKIEKILEAMK